MVTYKQKRELINTLTSNGYSILEVEIGSESLFFKTKSFEPPVGGSVSASPYLQWEGIDITDFFDGNIHISSNQKTFLDLFKNSKYDNGELKNMNYMISDNHTWRFFE